MRCRLNKKKLFIKIVDFLAYVQGQLKNIHPMKITRGYKFINNLRHFQ